RRADGHRQQDDGCVQAHSLGLQDWLQHIALDLLDNQNQRQDQQRVDETIGNQRDNNRQNTSGDSTDKRDKAGEGGNKRQHERQRHAQGPQAQTNEESIDKSDRCLRLDKSSQRLPHAGKQLSDVPANGRTGVLAYPRQKAVSVFQNEKEIIN